MSTLTRLLFFFGLLPGAVLYAQPATSASESVRLVPAQERYLPGDSVWFVAALHGGGEVRSQVVYVELLNPTGQLMHRHQLRLEQGMATGVFALPGGLPGGQTDTLAGAYQLRAFTRLMAQAPSPQVERRTIWVFPTEADAGFQPEVAAAGATELVLFPVGGTLLADQPTEVAFRFLGKASDAVLLNDSKQKFY